MQVEKSALWRRVEIFVLILTALMTYGPSLFNGFVYDDEFYVVRNPLVAGPLDLGRIFSEPYSPGHPEQGLYRPLVTLSFRVDHAVWGGGGREAFGFHLTNMGLHALNACLFLLLLRRLGAGRWLGFWSAMLFAVHPACTEAVAWVAQRADLMGMAFGLTGLLVLTRYSAGVGGMLFGVFWILSMLCKENWLMLPALAGVLVVSFPGWLEKSAGWRGRSWRFWVAAGILAAGVAVLFWWGRSMVVGWRPALSAFTGVVSVPSRVTTALWLLWQYVGVWLWPFRLSVYHDVHPLPGGWMTAGLAASWLAVLWLVWRRRAQAPWFLAAAGWFLAAIFPMSNLLTPVGAVFGERFLYPAALFFAPALILAGWKGVEALFPMQKRGVGMAAAVMGCLAALALVWLRLADWRSNLTLWQSAERSHPGSLAVQGPLADALLRSGRFDEAHEVAARAVERLEKQPAVYRQIFGPRLAAIDAAAQTAMGRLAFLKRFESANDVARSFRLKEALPLYRALMRDYPEEPEVFEAAGDLYIRLENPVAARQHYQEAIKLGREAPQLFAKYGTVLGKLGLQMEALKAYNQALRGNPADVLVHHNRGRTLAALGEYEEALLSFRLASKHAPDFPEPRLEAAAVLIHLRRYDEAEKEVAQALAKNPRQEQAGELLARIAKARGK
ncbi:MAG: tetratricopeptide repeat protein [Verrucomicrobiae bacterium]|nr:tetratricopeptide repeat protein [Verrucomicrobiae bacterium]